MFRVEFSGTSIHLMDGDTEIVMWDQAEWREDPNLVPHIVNAVCIGYTQGAQAVSARVTKGNS